MAVLLVVNLKGGLAKTTSSVAIAECLASEGFRTLLIDADHQCMAGELLLGEDRQLRAERSGRNLYDLLARMLDEDFGPDQFDAAVTPRASNIGGGLAKLSVLPCSIRIDDFSTNMAKARRGHRSNDEFLRTLDRRRRQLRRWANATYDYTVVDCPPSLAVQVKFLFGASDGFILPAIPDRLSVRGSLYLLDRLRSHGYKSPGLGTLWSLVRVQNRMHPLYVGRAARGEPPFDRLPRPFDTAIPNAAPIAEASDVDAARPASFQKKYTPQFAALFRSLCGEIVQRSEWQRSTGAATAEAATA